MRVGEDLAQGADSSVTLTREALAKNLKCHPAPPGLRAGREMRQCVMGELRCVSAVSRPDTCVRLARIASRINSLRGSGVRRIIELALSAKGWRKATALKHASPSHPWRTPGGVGKAKDNLCNRGEEMHCGWTSGADEGRRVLIGMRYRTDVVVVNRAVPCFAMDIQVYPENSVKQPGRRSIRAK